MCLQFDTVQCLGNSNEAHVTTLIPSGCKLEAVKAAEKAVQV